MNSKLYPKSPVLKDYEFLKPSEGFKKTARSVIISIVLFVLFYLLLIAFSIGVLLASIYAGIAIISIVRGFVTFAIGGGIIVLGFMFFVFTIKFIFSRNKEDSPERVELKEVDHPELFAFIRQLAEETHTAFPKKIYVSPVVNASVFYNSSFWSLFFPVRKNLEIGLGLVNVLTVSELKGVLAHEFGHFSQRSMRLGSYIFRVNRLIYNLVFVYDRWDGLLEDWKESGGIFGFFAGLTFWMVEGVRSLLKIAYNWINIYYMKLSREMEYHADLVAVSVSGNEAFKSALRKLDFAGLTFQYTHNQLVALAEQNKMTKNFFQNYTDSTRFLAKENQIEWKNGQFIITDEVLQKVLSKSRVKMEDQWASHPELEDREASFNKVGIEAELNNQSAWTLFMNPEQLQEAFTRSLYSEELLKEKKADYLEENEFTEFIKSETNKYRFAEAYNGYYSDHMLNKLDIEQLIQSEYRDDLTFQKVYAPEKVAFIKRLGVNKGDLELLKQIQLKKVPNKFFEFEGERYKRQEVVPLIKQLKLEIEAAEESIERFDREAFLLNYQLAKAGGQEEQYLSKYRSYQQTATLYADLDGFLNELHQFSIDLDAHRTLNERQVKTFVDRLSGIEKRLKDYLKAQDVETLSNAFKEEEKKDFLTYMKSDRLFNLMGELNLEGFFTVRNIVFTLLMEEEEKLTISLKRLTDFQLTFNTDLVEQ